MDLKIREIRNSRNITQAALGKAVGVSMRVVSGWERKETDITLIDAAKVADVLECTLDELAGRDFQREAQGTLTSEENALIGLYRDANAQGQATIMGVAQIQRGVDANSASPPGTNRRQSA